MNVASWLLAGWHQTLLVDHKVRPDLVFPPAASPIRASNALRRVVLKILYVQAGMLLCRIQRVGDPFGIFEAHEIQHCPQFTVVLDFDISAPHDTNTNCRAERLSLPSEMEEVVPLGQSPFP